MKILSVFLMLALAAPAALWATPPETAEQTLPEVQTSPVSNPTGTAEKRGEQARHSDDLGQSSTALVTQVRTYDQLVAAIRQTRAASESRIEAAVEKEKVREAWETGRLIDAHVLRHKERAEYGKEVISKLAQDLGTSETELGYMLQFARAYPISRPAGTK